MARRSFEMYEIRQIIVYLRSGETIRGIAQTKLANPSFPANIVPRFRVTQ